MCWYGKKSDLKVAKRDTKVKKILYIETFKGNKDFNIRRYSKIISPYQGSVYNVGETYEQEVTPEKDTYFETIRIDKGLHCYSNKCPHKFEKHEDRTVLYIGNKRSFIKRLLFGIDTITTDLLNVISEHDDTENKNAYKTILLAEFIIPSGTKYYENNVGEIVAEKYIFKNYTKL